MKFFIYKFEFDLVFYNVSPMILKSQKVISHCRLFQIKPNFKRSYFDNLNIDT